MPISQQSIARCLLKSKVGDTIHYLEYDDKTLGKIIRLMRWYSYGTPNGLYPIVSCNNHDRLIHPGSTVVLSIIKTSKYEL